MDREEWFAIMLRYILGDAVAALNCNLDVMALTSQLVAARTIRETTLNVVRRIKEIQTKHCYVTQIIVLSTSVLDTGPADGLPIPSPLASLNLSSPLPLSQALDMTFFSGARTPNAASGTEEREGESKPTGKIDALTSGSKQKRSRLKSCVTVWILRLSGIFCRSFSTLVLYLTG